jgi:hypothetical protein
MEEMYYREFGIPARIARCFSVEEAEEQKIQYDGKKNCYVSVYTFDDLYEQKGKTEYTSAVLNTIWFDFDDNKNIENCLRDVRKFYRKYCKPNNIEPRIYFTGGRGFQMNIDFWCPLELPNSLKRQAIREYLTHLKNKFKLKTLDEVCIKNTVSCMRRYPNTAYVSKLTGERNGYYCRQFPSKEILTLSMVEIMEASKRPNIEEIETSKSKRALRDFLDFVCDLHEVPHTVSNSVEYLLSEIRKKDTHESSYIRSGQYIKPPRKCVMELIERKIDEGHSSHEENNVIAMELLNAGWRDSDISFVFRSIYKEPAGDYGWYEDDPTRAGKQIRLMQMKEVKRYGSTRLKDMGICTDKTCK